MSLDGGSGPSIAAELDGIALNCGAGVVSDPRSAHAVRGITHRALTAAMIATEEGKCDILYSLFLELYQLDEVAYGVIEDGDDGGADVGRHDSEMHSHFSVSSLYSRSTSADRNWVTGTPSALSAAA